MLQVIGSLCYLKTSWEADFCPKRLDEENDLADKVEYLIQVTVSGSQARNIVESFPATRENYRKSVES